MPTKYSRAILDNVVVVVIDDDPLSLQVARIILEHHSATVHTGTDGQEGIAQVNTVKPHFVISDLSMPIMDGWTFLQKMKEDDATREIPVIALTAHAMKGDRERALEAGFHHYLTKPLTPTTFMSELLTRLMNIPTIAAQLCAEAAS